mgnify:FL=1
MFLRNPTDENVIPIVEELCRRLPMRRDVGPINNKVEGNPPEVAKRVPSRSRLPVIQDIEEGKF